jgi:GntR family transcriptional regulator, gluconate operon transcriptional repressor
MRRSIRAMPRESELEVGATNHVSATERSNGNANLRPLQTPRPLAEDAADRIREEILSGGFRPGEHLVEARIAQQLNVSRGPVREAFKLLRAEGLLQEEPRRGTFVVSLSSDDVREIYGLRAAIEGRAARMLARAGDGAGIDRLHELAADIDAAVKAGDGAAVARADLAFHEGLCELSGNRRLSEVFMRYIPMLRALLRLDERVYRSMDEIALQHRPLVEAIASGSEDGAAAVFRRHSEQAGELIAAYIDSLPSEPRG